LWPTTHTNLTRGIALSLKACGAILCAANSFALVAADLAPNFLSGGEFALGIWIALLGGGSDGSWRGALGTAQRQIPARIDGTRPTHCRLVWRVIFCEACDLKSSYKVVRVVPCFAPVQIAAAVETGEENSKPPSEDDRRMRQLPAARNGLIETILATGDASGLATGHTDMRRGFPSLARLVQESLKGDPHAGDLYVFRGRRGDLIKIIWHDGQGPCLFTKRLERGRFLWPSLADGVVTISVMQLSYLPIRHRLGCRRQPGIILARRELLILTRHGSLPVFRS